MDIIVINILSIIISTVTIIFNVIILTENNTSIDINSTDKIEDRSISLPRGSRVFPKNN